MEAATVSKSYKYRRIGLLESLGTAFSSAVPGSLRSHLKAGYNRVRLWATLGRGYRCHLPDGEELRILPSSGHISWNPAEYRAFKAAVSRGDVALDIGANVGCYTLLLGIWVGGDGRVFAFEPAPEPFRALSHHIALNGLGGSVVAVPTAVADRSAQMLFSTDDFQGMNRLVTEPPHVGTHRNTREVSTVTIDEFCAKHSLLPTFIKIDVEGFELAALRGGRETIKACGEKLALFIELHPHLWDSIGVTKEDILAEMNLQGLRIEPLESATDPWKAEGICSRLSAIGSPGKVVR